MGVATRRVYASLGFEHCAAAHDAVDVGFSRGGAVVIDHVRDALGIANRSSRSVQVVTDVQLAALLTYSLTHLLTY